LLWGAALFWDGAAAGAGAPSAARYAEDGVANSSEASARNTNDFINAGLGNADFGIAKLGEETAALRGA
jgi:hypothetical protein